MKLSQMLLLTAVILASRVLAFGGEPAGVEFFEKRIRPILIRHCYECHSAASSELKGGLRLDSRDFIRKGGESGPAVVPGNTEKSLLLDAIRHESFKMPPDRKLSADIIADFTKWIESGSPDPRDEPPSSEEVAELSWRSVLEERREWWSLQPVVATRPPATGPQQPIDAFVSAKQQAARIKPAKPAGARILARRLSLVLTGLPPALAEIEQFAITFADNPDAAYEAYVDRLLDSPHFGEHWACHWLDVVRFAETHGYEWNHEIRDAWRYRDYLIRAFNNDVPYDQLVREHIAGDLLESPRTNQELGINESLIGTAFWRFGELGHDDCVDFPEIRFDALDNQIDTFAKAFQALTISCSRCHDHKLDAISTRDYYALVGVLENCSQVVHTLDSPDRIANAADEIRKVKGELRQLLGKEWLAAVEPMQETMVKALAGKGDLLSKAEDSRTPGRENPGYVLLQFVRSSDSQVDGHPEWAAASEMEPSTMDPWRISQESKGKQGSLARDIPSGWKQLADEYRSEHDRREKAFAANREVWADYRSKSKSDWSISGLGLAEGPNQAGEFTLAEEGEQIVTAILPAGFHTNVLSNRLNGSIRSPWLPTERKFISVQILGDQQSMVRTVVDSCGLNEFAGGGLSYLDGGQSTWKTFPTSAGPGLRSFLELTTRSDNPRWPDRPGRAGSVDPKVVDDYRSSFGIIQAVLHDTPEGPAPSLAHMLVLFKDDAPDDPSGIATVYQGIAHNAITAWKDGRATDGDVDWLNWFLQSGLLPNTSVKSQKRLQELINRYRAVASSIPEPRVMAGLADQASNRGFPVLTGGDPRKPGTVVPARYLEVLSGSTPFETTGSGRIQLAEQIASPDNPLTARVMVNRVWHHLFGRGIVVTTDDFGRMGEKPTHPELLDFLADRFVKDGWSVKRLVRHIVLSETFRRSSTPDREAEESDPGNRLLHHYPARRMDAESIRDTFLTVSGRLNRQMFGPGLHPHRAKEVDYRKLFIGPLDGDGRRSIYIKVTRMEGPQFLELFDFPDRMVTRGKRDRTNVPAQALAMLNDPFVMDQAHFWAEQLVKSEHDSIEARVQVMFQRAVGRPPGETELQRFVSLVRCLADDPSADEAALLRDKNVWQDAAHAMFNLKELAYIP